MTPTACSSRFSFAHPAIVCGRVLLRDGHLELKGWGLRGRYRRQISLDDVQHMDAPQADLLVLWLADGELLRLRLDGANRWKQWIDERAVCAADTGSPRRHA